MIRVELDDAAVLAALARLDGRLADMTPLMQDIGEYVANATKQRFVAGTAPDGTAWAPKTQTTLDTQAARGDRPDPRPLWGPSGTLRTTITYQAGRDRVEVGSPAVYAAVQQFGQPRGASGSMANGSPIPWGDIPARPFLCLSPEDRAAVIDIVEEWLEIAAAGA
jgi:phage virion morphogenesis protein